MGVMTGYFDAGGHPDGEVALVVGGYVSLMRKWRRFETKWRDALGEVGIDVMHMSDFMACKKGFECWKGRADAQDELLVRLSKIIKTNAYKSFAESVLLDDWRIVNASYRLKESGWTPYALGGFYVMDRAIRWWGRKHPKDSCEFVFEDGDKNKGHFITAIDNVVKAHPKVLRGLKPQFQPKKSPPLQAADFVAWEHRKLISDFQNGKVGVRTPFLELEKVPNT